MSTSKGKTVRVGVIGLGFMGATHVRAYLAAARDGHPCRLVAVCDHKQSRREGKLWDVGGNIDSASNQQLAFDPNEVRSYAQPEELLADAEIDLVSICTPTDTHVDQAMSALRAGKHVLVEKPVALRADDIRAVQRVAQESGKLCMPAMCMRFWPGWQWLKQRIDDRTFGRCLGLTLTRIGSMPAWSRFYGESSRSGGALVDLHIHDADFVRYCFGDPLRVFSVGSVHHVTTFYQFARGKDHVPLSCVAEGAWLAPGTPFRMRYLAEFEDATVDFDLSRAPQLLVCQQGNAKPVDLGHLNGYDEEIRHFVNAIVRGDRDVRATLDDAIAVADLLETEKLSIERSEIAEVQREVS